MNVLISGAGIAGPCLAFWLRRHGFQPTIVERAPRLRTGGYVIDFWGAGFDVADRMGLVPQLLEKGYKVREVRQVDRNGGRVSSFPVRIFDTLTQGRYTSLPRSALAATLYEALGGSVETIFDDSVVAIDDTGREVRVNFEHAAPRAFDLVIGADGLHSQVRRLAFGDGAGSERFLGIKVAAADVGGYRPRDELVYVAHRTVGRQLGRFSLRDDRTFFLFVFADDNPVLPGTIDAQRAVLREEFADSGWECPNILAALGRASDLYMDRVSQVHLDRWSRGRVALVGDAAFCPSFLAGQGSALAMVAAYILAGELKRADGDHERAFQAYENRLQAFIGAKQRAAIKLTSFFVPNSRFSIFVGDQVMKLMAIPFVADLAVGRSIRDRVDLPYY